MGTKDIVTVNADFVRDGNYLNKFLRLIRMFTLHFNHNILFLKLYLYSFIKKNFSLNNSHLKISFYDLL